MPGFKYTLQPGANRRHRRLRQDRCRPATQDLPTARTATERADAGSVTMIATCSHLKSHSMKTKAHSVAASFDRPCHRLWYDRGFLGAAHADSLLTGTVTSAAGEKMGGVTVSAKAGRVDRHHERLYRRVWQSHYFPPLPNGQYQRLGASVNLPNAPTASTELKKNAPRFRPDSRSKTRRIGFGSCPAMNFSPPFLAIPPEDYRMKTQVRKNCTGCHSASYPLQHRFDETVGTRF